MVDNEAHVCLLAPITMESPSRADHNAWTAALMVAAQDSTVINGFYTTMQGATASPGQINDKLATAGMSDELRLQNAQNFSRDTGLVHISSGMTDVLCGRRLDWALVGLTGSQFAGGIQNLSNVSAKHYYSSSSAVLIQARRSRPHTYSSSFLSRGTIPRRPQNVASFSRLAVLPGRR